MDPCEMHSMLANRLEFGYHRFEYRIRRTRTSRVILSISEITGAESRLACINYAYYLCIRNKRFETRIRRNAQRVFELVSIK